MISPASPSSNRARFAIRASCRPARAGRAPARSRSRQRRRVVNILAFALRIEAAGLNRRLKQDIVDQDPEFTREGLKQVSFFEPEPSEEALHVFQKYVDIKWPLRVYAIEPVIAQQNVADALPARKFLALDLLGANYVGPFKALTGIEAQRQAADDETAIRLNPTMVGFGAGQSTFGWIFYPRLQTNTDKRSRLVTDIALLVNGRVPDPTGNDQSIEPGQRECTALVEMPNFVPKIEFVTVANWFRTSEVGDGQKSDLEKAGVLGRKLVLAEEALNRARIEGHYRPEEYQIAFERLNQLKSLMPTQRMVVRVPFGDNQNDARIFCSHGSQLRPTLTGWHGNPPQEGDETTLFLEGLNFSIHDTHVIAGGKPASAMLVSRQLLQVTIPKDACSMPMPTGTAFLDINVATPNGVSNHLHIKMGQRDAARRRLEGENEARLASEARTIAERIALSDSAGSAEAPLLWGAGGGQRARERRLWLGQRVLPGRSPRFQRCSGARSPVASRTEPSVAIRLSDSGTRKRRFTSPPSRLPSSRNRHSKR